MKLLISFKILDFTLSLPGALLFGNLHIILIISSAETGLQNMPLTSIRTVSKSNCPQVCNDCTKFAPIEQKHSFNLIETAAPSDFCF